MSFFNRKQRRALNRALPSADQINNQYGQVCAAIGDSYLKISAIEAHIASLTKQANLLGEEMAKVNAQKAEEVKSSQPKEALSAAKQKA